MGGRVMRPLTGSGSLLTMAIGIILQIDTGPNHQKQRSPGENRS